MHSCHSSGEQLPVETVLKLDDEAYVAASAWFFSQSFMTLIGNNKLLSKAFERLKHVGYKGNDSRRVKRGLINFKLSMIKQ